MRVAVARSRALLRRLVKARFFYFQDPQNKSALPVIHLIDAMKSGVIDYSIVKSGEQLIAKVIFTLLTFFLHHTLP